MHWTDKDGVDQRVSLSSAWNLRSNVVVNERMNLFTVAFFIMSTEAEETASRVIAPDISRF